MAWYRWSPDLASPAATATVLPTKPPNTVRCWNANGGDWSSAEIEATADIKEHCGANFHPLIAEKKRDEEADSHHWTGSRTRILEAAEIWKIATTAARSRTAKNSVFLTTTDLPDIDPLRRRWKQLPALRRQEQRRRRMTTAAVETDRALKAILSTMDLDSRLRAQSQERSDRVWMQHGVLASARIAPPEVISSATDCANIALTAASASPAP